MQCDSTKTIGKMTRCFDYGHDKNDEDNNEYLYKFLRDKLSSDKHLNEAVFVNVP